MYDKKKLLQVKKYKFERELEKVIFLPVKEKLDFF